VLVNGTLLRRQLELSKTKPGPDDVDGDYEWVNGGEIVITFDGSNLPPSGR
jgi:hypothetical protein